MRQSPEEMAQRQVEGRCFNCLEKFTPGHHKECSMKGIYFLEIDEETTVEDGEDDP